LEDLGTREHTAILKLEGHAFDVPVKEPFDRWVKGDGIAAAQGDRYAIEE
jgi:hypothetical protein